MPATAIDAAFVPKVRPEVCDIEVDGEIVVFHERTYKLHLLNATASVAWRCFDGSATLTDISGDLADVYDTDSARVLASLIEIAQSVGALGLLEGVEAEATDD